MNVPVLSFRIGGDNCDPVSARKSNSASKEPPTNSIGAQPSTATKTPEVLPAVGATSKPRRKRTPWTKEEDSRFIQLVKEAGLDDTSSNQATQSFSSIADRLSTGRSAKQCRDRWKNFLRDGIKKGEWSAEEEDLINSMFMTFGPKWAAMAKVLDDRTDNDIKNKWYSMKRKEDRAKLKGPPLHPTTPVASSDQPPSLPNNGYQPQNWASSNKKRRAEY